jgi:hypothetical protein
MSSIAYGRYSTFKLDSTPSVENEEEKSSSNLSIISIPDSEMDHVVVLSLPSLYFTISYILLETTESNK